MTSDRELALDAGLVVGVGAAVVVWGESPAVMGIVVAAAFALRLAVMSGRGLGLLLICTLVGAFNDWNTVDRHGVYTYALPSEAPHISTIPLWMLAYWGLILRFVASLAWSGRLGVPKQRPLRHLLLMIGIVLVTRQCIYRWWADPVLSWLPFALAAVLWIVVLRPDQQERRLALLALTVGTGAEVVLIGAGLHHYALGWFGGVPLWIVLWWPMATLVWKEVSGYALAGSPDLKSPPRPGLPMGQPV